MNRPPGVAWIIGGGSGIGAALARQLAGEGWTVAISGRREDALDAVCRMATGIHPYPLDATLTERVTETAERIASDLGRIDLMVYAAAAWQPMKVGDYDFQKFFRIVDTNYLGAVRAIEAATGIMRRQGGGEIALVASIAGYAGLPRAAAYGSTKAALIHLAQTLRTELAPENISVRLVNPGFVSTDLTAKNDFPMPFLMDAEEAARRIAHGLLHTARFEIAFPWQMVMALKLLRVLPYWLFFRLMARLIPQGAGR